MVRMTRVIAESATHATAKTISMSKEITLA
jgi:hypothetical protein